MWERKEVFPGDNLFCRPWCLSIVFYVVVQCYNGGRHNFRWYNYAVQRAKPNKKICSLKKSLFHWGKYGKNVKCLKVCVLFAKAGKGVGKFSEVEAHGSTGNFTQVSCYVTLRGSEGRCHLPRLAGLGHRAQSGRPSSALGAEAGNWPKSLFFREETGSLFCLR